LRELVLEVRKDIKLVDAKLDRNRDESHREFQRVDSDLARRPTRAEVISWFTLAGVLSGIVATVLS
jgi:hypothetical protein